MGRLVLLASALGLGAAASCTVSFSGSGELGAGPRCVPTVERGAGAFDPADHVQMRDGSAYVGTITNRTFSVQPLSSPAPLTFGRDEIVWMVFRNDYDHAEDRIRLKDASEIGGVVLETEIGLVSASLGRVSLPTADILAVQFLGALGE